MVFLTVLLTLFSRFLQLYLNIVNFNKLDIYRSMYNLLIKLGECVINRLGDKIRKINWKTKSTFDVV